MIRRAGQSIVGGQALGQAYGEAKGYRHGAVMVGERGTHRGDRGKLSYTGVVSITL